MELSERDRRIIATIEQTRAVHDACTAAWVARQLKISRAYMSDVMHDMITRGILTFNAEIPGSLRLTPEAREFLFPKEASGPRLSCECGWPTAQALKMHQRKHSSS